MPSSDRIPFPSCLLRKTGRGRSAVTVRRVPGGGPLDRLGRGRPSLPSALCAGHPAGTAARLRAVRTPSRRWMDRRRAARVRPDAARAVGRHRVGIRVGRDRHRRVGWHCLRRRSRWRGSWVRARRSTCRTGQRRHARAAAGAAAGAGVDGTALPQPRARGRDRHPLLPRLLHGGFRVAQRARLRAGQVLSAAAQSLHGAARDELLLDLLSAARHGGPNGAGRRRFETSRPA